MLIKDLKTIETDLDKWGFIKFRGHHVSNFSNYVFRREVSNDESKYSRDFLNTFEDVFRRLEENPNTLILIVRDTEDSMCSVCDNEDKSKDKCKLEEDGYDKASLEDYELKIGEIYTSGELIKKMRKLKDKSGYSNATLKRMHDDIESVMRPYYRSRK